MHSYSTFDNAEIDKDIIETIIDKRGWLSINLFNKFFQIAPKKPIDKNLGWGRDALEDIKIEERDDHRFIIVMPKLRFKNRSENGLN